LHQLNEFNKNLIEMVRLLALQTEYQELLRLVAQKSAQFLNAETACILIINPDTRQTVKTIIKEGPKGEQKELQNVHTHIGGWIISNRQSFFSPELRKDQRFQKDLYAKSPFTAAAGVPLFIENIYFGALILLSENTTDLKKSVLLNNLEDLAAISAPFLRNSQKIREYFYPEIQPSSLQIKYNNAGLIGKSQKFIELLHTIEAAAKCHARVLLVGNTGTGKELVAKAIHQFSSRSEKPFLSIDCGAIPDNLVESELFGYKRGAFTGAQSDRSGIFLAANGGTLFMDEINNLSMEMQSKLLRVMEDGNIRPLGSDKTVQTDVRIISASSMPLKELVDKQQFREDLYYRLHVYPIYIPDLNERWEDIPILANHFLQIYVKEQQKNIKQFHDDLRDFIKQHTCNGNISELENFIQRLVTLASAKTSTLTPEIFPPDLHEELKEFRQSLKSHPGIQPLRDKIKVYESELIREALVHCNWNQSQAARKLQISEKNIRYRMTLLGIEKPK